MGYIIYQSEGTKGIILLVLRSVRVCVVLLTAEKAALSHIQIIQISAFQCPFQYGNHGINNWDFKCYIAIVTVLRLKLNKVYFHQNNGH